MMKSREYNETKKSGALLWKNRKNTAAKLGRHLVICPWRTGMNLCKKVEGTSMMKSREYDETKKSDLLRKNGSCTYFEAASFVLYSVLNLVWVWQRENPSWIPAPNAVERDHLKRLDFFSWLVTKTDTWIRTQDSLIQVLWYSRLSWIKVLWFKPSQYYLVLKLLNDENPRKIHQSDYIWNLNWRYYYGMPSVWIWVCYTVMIKLLLKSTWNHSIRMQRNSKFCYVSLPIVQIKEFLLNHECHVFIIQLSIPSQLKRGVKHLLAI